MRDTQRKSPCVSATRLFPHPRVLRLFAGHGLPSRHRFSTPTSNALRVPLDVERPFKDSDSLALTMPAYKPTQRLSLQSVEAPAPAPGITTSANGQMVTPTRLSLICPVNAGRFSAPLLTTPDTYVEDNAQYDFFSHFRCVAFIIGCLCLLAESPHLFISASHVNFSFQRIDSE